MTWIHSSEKDKITFWPPLHLQRQAWALNVLRKEGVASVLDIGCGEGSLIEALCSPSPTVSEPPILFASASPNEVAEHPYLHVQRIAGLDIDPAKIARAAANTLPRGGGSGRTSGRWTSLEVELWEGDLGQFNESLNNYEAMVALEVLEHLPPETLERFAPMILGEYRPRLLLITTPNYDFNQRFDREGEERKGWLDPTGRTERVFRHDDHKFEWTPLEFAAYCSSIAEEFNYEPLPTLLGPPSSSPLVPPAPTPTSTHATNACLFRRIDSSRPSRRSSRSFRTSSLPFLHPPDSPEAEKRSSSQHQLVKRVAVDAREEAGRPSEGEVIREAVRKTCSRWGTGEVGMMSMWSEVSGVCGGAMGELVKALGGFGTVPSPSPLPPLLDPSEWELLKETEDAELKIRWTKFVPPPSEAMEEDQMRGWETGGGGSESWGTESSRVGKEMDTEGW